MSKKKNKHKKPLGVWSNPEKLNIDKVVSDEFYGVPKGLSSCRIDTCKGKAKVILQNYFRDFETHYAEGRGIVFQSTEFGMGKSGAAAAAVRQCLFKGIIPYFTSCGRMMKDIVTGEIKDDSYSTGEWVTDKVDFLAIDELKLGTGRWAEITVENIESILKSRADSQRPTVVTTNLTMTQVQNQFGKNVSDILIANCIPVTLDDFNWRDLKKKTNLDYARKYLK